MPGARCHVSQRKADLRIVCSEVGLLDPRGPPEVIERFLESLLLPLDLGELVECSGHAHSVRSFGVLVSGHRLSERSVSFVVLGGHSEMNANPPLKMSSCPSANSESFGMRRCRDDMGR